jgi:hypothetical protein
MSYFDTSWQGIPASQVLEIWDSVEPKIASALEREETGFDSDHILTRIQSRQMQLWVHPKAAAVTQIQTYPLFKKLVLVIVGGRAMEEWLDDLMVIIADYGRENGCKFAEQWGRKGWLKVNDKHKYGARVAFYVMRKEL